MRPARLAVLRLHVEHHPDRNIHRFSDLLGSDAPVLKALDVAPWVDFGRDDERFFGHDFGNGSFCGKSGGHGGGNSATCWQRNAIGNIAKPRTTMKIKNAIMMYVISFSNESLAQTRLYLAAPNTFQL